MMKILSFKVFIIIILTFFPIQILWAQHPNIIYILTDDLGIGDVGAFNKNGKIATPNIDKLAAEGMRFADAHTASAVCTPTRYSILTGRYNWRSQLKSGVLTGKSKALIENTRTTVASMLQSKGYQTAFIGKWHLGWDWALKDSTKNTGDGWNAGDFEQIDYSKPIKNGPNSLGFQYAFGVSGSLDLAPYVFVENNMTVQPPDHISESKDEYGWWRKGPTAKDFIHHQVLPTCIEKAVTFIDQKAKAAEPFFIYLALPSPHTPILPTDEYLGKSGLNAYADYVMMTDAMIGKVLQAIENKGLEKNTLIVFTSDNGCSPQANFNLLAQKGHNPSYLYRGTKADIFEGGHRVPFIVKWAGKIKAGSFSDAVICTTDFMATAAEIVGYTLQDHEAEDSHSFWSICLEKTKKTSKPAVVHHSIDGSFAIRKGDWKLIMCAGSGGWSTPIPGSPEEKDLPQMQLYNIRNDIGEKQNLQARYPKKVKALKALLVKYITEGRSTPGKPQQNDAIASEWRQIEFTNN